MSVVLVRIDDRLVHGQIVEGWVKHLKPTQVIVVSDFLVDNSARRMVMELALPSQVRLEVFNVAQMAERGDLSQGSAGAEIILFASPADVLRAVNQGLQLTNLNLGGMHHFNGDRKLTTNISLTQGDVNDLKRLLALGSAVEIRALPQDKGVVLTELL